MNDFIILKIFDIDLNELNLTTLIKNDLDNICHIPIYYNDKPLIIQLPSMKIIDIDTNNNQLVLSFESSNILYDDILDDFIKELNNTFITKIKLYLSKVINLSEYSFENIFHKRNNVPCLLIDYNNSELFHQGEKVSMDNFNPNLNDYMKTIYHLDKIVIKDFKNIHIETKVYQLNILSLKNA